MKVIGKSIEGYLITASEGEIANLFGVGYASSDDFKKILQSQKKHHSSSLVGLEINVGVAYERLAWLKRRKHDFDSLCCDLRRTADKIDDARPVFSAIAADGLDAD